MPIKVYTYNFDPTLNHNASAYNCFVLNITYLTKLFICYRDVDRWVDDGY